MSIYNRFVAAFLALFALASAAVAQIETPRPSPAGSVSTVVGLTDVEVTYFRPKINGRQIFGDGEDYLVPYGEIWRTGANSGTVISFSEDVKVQGQPVPKGTYLMFTWPGATEWTISFYKDLSIGGNTAKYDRTKEAVSFKARPERMADAVETFTINISDVAEDNKSANLQLAWEHTSVKFSIGVEYDDKVMASIKKTDMSKDPEAYVTAAQYYFSQEKDLTQALQWMDAYLAMEGKDKEFYNVLLKADIQRSLNDRKGARATARRALISAKQAPNDFGYIKRIEDFIAELN